MLNLHQPLSKAQLTKYTKVELVRAIVTYRHTPEAANELLKRTKAQLLDTAYSICQLYTGTEAW